MNSAYKHLDSKLRIAELTIGQWIGVVLGLGLGIVWGVYLSPLGTTLTLSTAIYVAALPMGAVLCASLTDFDPWLTIRSAVRWRRSEGRFIPGPGASASGYVVREDPHARQNARPGGRWEPELDFAALWGESR